ncbi:MAG: beta-ketoacyl synthase chain length factor [Tannerella sp.]|jgi:3-oxoacyl-(acyl-carrier-protein) synthase|nr:beta-ketoacyl synthase chain length factor [Tannerella sp.]
MNKAKIYIASGAQITAQAPLCDDWMTEPLRVDSDYAAAQDPDYRQFFPPNEARRLGKILKRAIVVSRRAMEQAGIAAPDAIITGTGFGCIENTELFLKALVNDGEEFLKPTHFMQSTHNTISSLIAINCGCHGYNSTYSHRHISFESALADAFIRLRNGLNINALVGGHDELTPDFHIMLQRIDPLCAGRSFRSETAVALMLTAQETPDVMCRLDNVETFYTTNVNELKHSLERFLASAGYGLDDIDAVMTGNNGGEANERLYDYWYSELFAEHKRLHYKHLFGESFTSPASGVYVAATCLKNSLIPANLFMDESAAGQQTGIRRILLYHQTENKNHSLIIVSKCGN